jgi:hypothetical protein
MFEDEDENPELANFHQKYENIQDEKSPEMIRLSKKLTLGQFMKKIQNEKEEKKLRQIENEKLKQSGKDQPSTSHEAFGLDNSDHECKESEDNSQSFIEKLHQSIQYISCTMVTITKMFYGVSWKYRYVMRRLTDEKNHLKVIFSFRVTPAENSNITFKILER